MDNIKNIIFDLGGVVIDLERGNAVNALHSLGITDSDRLLGQYEQKGPFLLLESGLITASQFYDGLLPLCHPGTTCVDIQDAFEGFLVGLPLQRLRTICNLRRKGFKLFVLSNTNPVMYNHWIDLAFRQEGKSINDYFDGIVVSFQERTRKPDPQIFKNLLNRYHLNPQETLLLDDSEANCNSARGLGINAIQIKKTGDDSFSAVCDILEEEGSGKVNGNAAAIGTFDGVHLGHAAVISCLKEIASEKGLQPIAITFDRHPLSLIAPERAPLSITTIHKKEDLLSKAGVVPVVVPFDESLRSTTASDWMKMLRDDYNVEAIVVGYDNTFGCDGVALSVADYKEIGSRLGIEVTEAPFVAGISSSAIRKAISSGRIEEANAMLGRKFSLPGVVVEGNKLGRTIGFPTANILPHAGIVLPGNGVYAAFATLPDGSRRGAMVNVGTRPTVRRGNNMTIEAHILGWKGDIYGMPIKLTFVARMRDEEKFNSIEALRRQLEKDTAKTQIFLDKVSRQEK